MAKVKVQITLEDTLLSNLDSYCEKNYINRSAALSLMASQFLMQQQLMDSLSDLSYAMKVCAEKGGLDSETEEKVKEFELLAKIVTGNR